MDLLNGLFVRAREWSRGQTMTEYAMILSAVAIAVLVTYEVFGQDVSSMVNHVDGSFTAS
jgi:Flp pilus assembly pilin Flp